MSTTPSQNHPILEWGVAKCALPGEEVSGDQHLVQPFTHGALVAVVDGLGHGQDATTAARVAVSTLTNRPGDSVIALVKRCHEALTKTRGAVTTLASFNILEATMTWLGVENVEGVLIRADTRATPATESVLLRGGVVGYQLPALQAGVVPVSRGDLLILATDGIRSGFVQNLIATDPPQQIADRILAQHFKGTDDALALVVRYRGMTHE